MDLVTSFMIASGIILLGFIANVIFRKTYIPDTLSLIFLGVLIGPLFTYLTGISIFSRDQILSSTEYIAELTLALVMFDTGLSLDLYKMIKESPRGLAFSLMDFGIGTVAVAVMAKGLLHLRWSYCLFLGSVLATTGSADVLPLVMKMRFGEEVKHIIAIQAALTDVYTLIAATTLLSYMGGQTANIYVAVKGLVSTISVGLFTGGLIGLAWLYVMKRLSREEHGYVATLGILLLVYTVTAWLGGSGAMAALAFGLIIGNYRFLTLILGIESSPLEISGLTVKTRSVHGEITFIMRAFFFAAIGLIYTLPISELTSLPIALVASLLLLLERAFSIYSTVPHPRASEVWTAASLYGRGLVPAIFAQLLITLNLPLKTMIYNIIINTIILTNVLMTLGVYAFAGKMRSSA